MYRQWSVGTIEVWSRKIDWRRMRLTGLVANIRGTRNTGCPTTYQTRHFFNNSKTNEDIATRFEQEYVRCVRNEEECVCSAPSCCDTEQRSASQPACILPDAPLCLSLCHLAEGSYTCRDTLILKIPVFGQVKIPTQYMKNPFIQRRLVFGVGYPGGT